MRSAHGSPARGTSRESRRRWWASLADWTAAWLVLARASGLARWVGSDSPRAAPVATRRTPDPTVACRPSCRGGQRLGLQELERLHVEQARGVAHDVGVAQRLEELLRAVDRK